ncbi:uncharacterized protein METZ01_LOCUS148940, partial [marine metagenome]
VPLFLTGLKGADATTAPPPPLAYTRSCTYELYLGYLFVTNFLIN